MSFETKFKNDMDDTNSAKERKDQTNAPSKIQQALETAASALRNFFDFTPNSASSSNSDSVKADEKDEVVECKKLKDILLKCLQTNFTQCEDIQKEFKDCIVKYGKSSK